MAISKQENWEFLETPQERLWGGPSPSQPFMSFATLRDIARHLSQSEQDLSFLSGKIAEQQAEDPVIQEWRRQRTPFNRVPHFRKYWTSRKDIYGDAAFAVRAGTATAQQVALVAALIDEIKDSQVTIDLGQTLFHGRQNPELSAVQPFPGFVLASFNPAAAAFAAANVMRAGKDRPSQGYLYILTLRRPLQALWGETRTMPDYRLLLPPSLTVVVTSSTAAPLFTVVEATIG